MDDLTLSMLEYLKLALFLLNICIAAFVVYSRSRNATADGDEDKDARRGPILFVIAHPDDEAMFFVPSILALAQSNRSIHLLCLSTGDYEGPSTGKVRTKELYASASGVLGIKKADIKIIDDEELRDGPLNRWNEDRIARIVKAYVDEQGVETVITFDEGGVSAHPNHIAVFHGVARFLALHASATPSSSSSDATPSSSTSSTLKHRASTTAATASPPVPRAELRGFKLETTNLVRKYVGPLDVVWSSLTAQGEMFVAPGWLAFWSAHRAMQAHHSQYVWFRRLSVPFSRYSYVNTLLPVLSPTTPPSPPPSSPAPSPSSSS